MIYGWNLNKWRYPMWFVRNMWFFQTRNNYGLKFEQIAIFRVLRQKQVVFPNSNWFWAELWKNGDFLCGSSETCRFSKLEIILGWNLEVWRFSMWFIRNMWFFKARNNFGLKFGQMAIFHVVHQKHMAFPHSNWFWAEIWTIGLRGGVNPPLWRKIYMFKICDGIKNA